MMFASARLGLIGLILLCSTAARAASIADFAGDWAGSGVVEAIGDVAPGVEERELDVKISLPDGKGSGFLLLAAWQDAGVPNTPETPLKLRGFDFKPLGPGKGWAAQERCDPTSQPCIYARVVGESLIVTSFQLTPTGQAETQVFTRTLTPSGLSSSFVRNVDGWPVRRVSGLLQRRRI